MFHPCRVSFRGGTILPAAALNRLAAKPGAMPCWGLGCSLRCTCRVGASGAVSRDMCGREGFVFPNSASARPRSRESRAPRKNALRPLHASPLHTRFRENTEAWVPLLTPSFEMSCLFPWWSIGRLLELFRKTAAPLKAKKKVFSAEPWRTGQIGCGS